MHNEILKIAKAKFKYLNYSERTAEIYLHYMGKFLEATGKYHQHLVSADFQTYLDSFNFSSISQQNQVINAIRFLYKEVLGKKYDKVNFQRPRKEKHLPRIINQEVIREKLAKIKNLKHRAILSLAFSVGLRVSEVINLKIADIDSASMIINIRQAKGNKDRIVPLSPFMLDLLRQYFKAYKPKEYLFNGQFTLQYSAQSCNQITKQHFGPAAHFHMLRHSSFTSMLENGTDLRIIQKIAGHNSSKTTEIYTHVTNRILLQAVTPL